MLGLLILLQTAGQPAPPAPPPPAPPAASAPAPAASPQTPAAPADVAPQPAPSAPAAPPPPPGAAAPAPPPPAAGAPPPPPAGYAPYPYYYPYPYPPPPYAYPPPPAPPAETPPPAPPEPERDVSWFVRLSLGLGTPGFSAETELLKLEGYGGAKLWATIDGGYLVHPNLGVGAWAAISRWSSSPDDEAPSLGETAYFIGGELPIRFGSRSASLVFAPRLGFCSGEIDIGGDVPSQQALAYGAELSFVTFKGHFSASIGFLRATVPPPGELGRDHDFGGLQLLLGGTIDG